MTANPLSSRLNPELSFCSLVRKKFTLLHVFDNYTRAWVEPADWERPPPSFTCAPSLLHKNAWWHLACMA